MFTFTANLRLVATDAGGRRRPIRSGYIAGIKYDGYIVDGVIHLLDCEVLFPGGKARVSFGVPRPDGVKELWEVGRAFAIVEGLRTIGIGEVLTLEPPET